MIKNYLAMLDIIIVVLNEYLDTWCLWIATILLCLGNENLEKATCVEVWTTAITKAGDVIKKLGKGIDQGILESYC